MIQTAEQAAQAEDLLVRIREASARFQEAERILGHNDDRTAEQAYRERLAELRRLGAQIPDSPRSFADIVALAELASHEDMNVYDDVNVHCYRFMRLAVGLVTAILQFAEACEGVQEAATVGEYAAFGMQGLPQFEHVKALRPVLM
jgi:hypothetical protein